MPTAVEPLGEVLFPSGAALVVDAGLLRLWCHDLPPRMPDGVLSSPAATDSANRAQDFRIDGPDAERAGQLYRRERHGDRRYLFDVPGQAVDELRQTFRAFLTQSGLDARLVPLVPRVTHLERVALALAQGEGGGLQFHGIPAVAIAGLPPGRRLKIIGLRRGESHASELWQWVGVEVAPGVEVARSLLVGTACLDWARLMFVDPRSLGAWQHEESIDGRADFVFWGPPEEAGRAAERFGATALGEGQFGWRDLPVDEAARRGAEVEAAAAKTDPPLSTDFRPHSHQHQLLEQLRASATASGTLPLEDGLCCAVYTGWGEGLFPVFRDLDAAGRLVRIRVELATEAAIAAWGRVKEGGGR